jgi:hypothetical protein
LKLTKTFLFRFFILGLVVFLILGISALIFLDKYYLVDNSNFEMVLTSSKKTINAKVYLPQNVQKVLYSDDGDYISYIENDSIQVVDLNSGEKSTIAASDNMTLSYYKWVSNRDRIILAEKSDSKKYFKIYSYDVVNKNTVEIYDVIKKSSMKIDTNGNSDAVTDIQTSNSTNIFYVKMTNSNHISHLYYFDANLKRGNIYLPYNNIGTINLLNSDDKLLYENLDNNKIYLRGRSTAFTIENKKYFKILGSDNNDVIYLAEYDGSSNKTSYIYYGNDSKKWVKSTPNMQLNISDIFVSTNGQIYVNDAANSVLFNITDSSHSLKTEYSGKFVGIYAEGIISLQNSQVIRTKFSK